MEFTQEQLKTAVNTIAPSYNSESPNFVGAVTVSSYDEFQRWVNDRRPGAGALASTVRRVYDELSTVVRPMGEQVEANRYGAQDVAQTVPMSQRIGGQPVVPNVAQGGVLPLSDGPTFTAAQVLWLMRAFKN